MHLNSCYARWKVQLICFKGGNIATEEKLWHLNWTLKDRGIWLC